jgi:hypothetical protein
MGLRLLARCRWSAWTWEIVNFDPFDRIVEGAAAIAEVHGQSEKRTRYLLERGLIDADKVGRIWITTARRAPRPVAGKPGRPEWRVIGGL